MTNKTKLNKIHFLQTNPRIRQIENSYKMTFSTLTIIRIKMEYFSWSQLVAANSFLN
jgi:hypothetical protein